MNALRLLALAAAFVVTACNTGQPRIYRVALNTAPMRNISDPSCFKANMVPGSSGLTESNLFVEQQWVIWDATGTDADMTPMQFIDVGHQAFKMGDSPAVDFDELIGTTNAGTFTGQRVQSSSVPNSYIEVRQTILTVTFSDTGAAPTGKLAADAKYECVSQGAPCPSSAFVSDPKSCRVELPFSARRIDVSRIAGYSEESKGGT